MAMSTLTQNNTLVGVLKHPVRREILRYLETTDGPASPKMMADALSEQLPNVSYHVRELAKSGVLKLASTKARRGALEHLYKRSGNALDKRAQEMLALIGKE